MYISVEREGAAASVVVREPTDRSRLHLRADTDLDEATIAQGLDRLGLGRLAGPDHVLLNVSALRELSEPGTGPGWSSDFEDMLRYAVERGWTEDDGRWVRAHRERN